MRAAAMAAPVRREPPLGPAAAAAAANAERIKSAIAHTLRAIEDNIARMAAGTMRPRELEQTSRALGTLTRTFRELNVLLAEYEARARKAEEEDDPVPENVDAFRDELVRRIRAFVASREAETERAALAASQEGTESASSAAYPPLMSATDQDADPGPEPGHEG